MNGLKDGPWVYYYSKGSSLEIHLSYFKDRPVGSISSDTIGGERMDCFVTDGVFKSNGYNKLYLLSDNLWAEGLFKNGALWDGKEYVYDTDGILLSVRIFEKGKFHRNEH